MIEISDKYKLNSNNYYKSKYDKHQIIVGSSLRKSNYGILRNYDRELGNSKNWNTFTISRNGEVFQHYDMQYYSDYLKIKDVDMKSISIVFENMGNLIKYNDKYYNYLNEECDDEVIKAVNSNNEYWEKFTLAQIESFKLLIEFISDYNNKKYDIIDYLSYNINVINFNGILFKSNYIKNTNDKNPEYKLLSII